MGDHENWVPPTGLLLNGLLPNGAASVSRALDRERWSIAEERTAELIACIQPNKPSEERRNAVADYVQRLIMKCFTCQVFTFGSVPLKTYLPDGDIDLTAFSKNQNLKDIWANKVRDMLENEEKSENAEFRVKEVQYIQAEVKIIKCLVENIVVDISFDQLGGLCTLCFLEEVDHLISQNHLFKRSIILIKAWCYYESRILGAHHGLISTYALETLVLYIFHVFNNSFAGPLEVLYRFLEFFSNFDWDNFCVSLWGPIPIISLPDMTAEPPRKDSGELLLSKLFLDACSSVYAVLPGGQENQSQPFVSKHFNVIDPLRINNNLGRSVSKGNFFRIRSAFAFGAKRLARLLDCPKENLIDEVNQFFTNTLGRHDSGCRPDAPSADLWRLRSLNSDHVDGSENLKNYSSSKKKNQNSTAHESVTKGTHTLHGTRPLERMSRTTHSQRNHGNLTVSMVSNQVVQNISSSGSVSTDKGHRSSRPDYLMNEVQGRYSFARTRSSPELTDTSTEVITRGRRNRVPETIKSQIASSRSDYSWRKNLGSEVLESRSARSSTDDSSSTKHDPSHRSLDTATDSNITSNGYHDEADLGAAREELASVTESLDMYQEEQDLVNMMESSRLHGFGGQVQMPINFASPHPPHPISPSVLASMGFAKKNLVGMVPTNIPFIDPTWGSNMKFSPGLVSSPLSQYFHSIGLASNPKEMIESSNENSGLTEVNDHGFWHNQDSGSTRGFDVDDENFQMLQLDDKQQPSSVGFNFVPLLQASSSDSSRMKGHHILAEDNKGLIREDHSNSFQYINNGGNEDYSTDRSSSLRYLSTSQASSVRSKASSESSWDGTSVKVSKLTRDKDKRGRRTSSSTVHGKGKSGRQYEGASVDHGSSQTDDDNRDWIPLSTMGTEMSERSTVGPTSVASLHNWGHQIASYEPTQMSASDTVIPIAPGLVASGSRQKAMDNSGVIPFAFYLAGPPVPYLTMLPVYNFPAEMGNSERSTNHFDREEMPDSAKSLDQSEIFNNSNSTKFTPSVDLSEDPKSDILNSDFASHWQNLQYGRFCQNPQYHRPLMHPSPVMVPPMYLQGHSPWDGPGRPLSANVNIFPQLMNYGPQFVPVAPLQPGSSRPAGVYQRYGDEVPRYRGGTGTYLPNPKPSFKERQSSNTRNHKGNYNYERNEHNRDREGNWNSNSRPRAAGRNHGRSQTERVSSRSDRVTASGSRADRSWDSYRHDSFPSHHSPFVSSNSTHGGSVNVAYSVPAANSNGVSTSGPVVMLYPYDRNLGYDSPGEQLEFGSLRPAHFSDMSEVSHLGEADPPRGVYKQQSFQGGSPANSSPDQPSSPQHRRSAARRNSQLKDEDFPPVLSKPRR